MIKVEVPRSVKIGMHRYRIRLEQTGDLEDEARYGDINHRTLVIQVNSYRHDSQRAEALLHEFVHAVDNAFLNNALVEKEVHILAQGLSQMLFDGLGIELDWSLHEKS